MYEQLSSDFNMQQKSLLFRSIILVIFVIVFGSGVRGQIANFTADSTVGCEQLVINFSDLSTGTITSWSWVVYNSSGVAVGFSPLVDPSFVLDVPGSYDVELTVCGPAGCDTRYVAGYITIYESPDVLWTASAMSGCPPINISFTDNTTSSGGSLVSRFWVIEGGPLLPTTSTINYNFTAPGVYNVLLLIEDDNGCRPFYKDSIEIFAPPSAVLSATDYSACNPPLNTTFSAAVTGTPPYTYAWNFGDGATSTAVSPSHTYTTSGAFTVSLTVTDGQGCVSTITEPAMIEVFPADVQFTTATPVGCLGEPLDFINTSTPSSGSWVWNFGDGSPVSGFASPSHTYTATGTYTVTLTGSFGSGCTGTFSQDITVQNLPTADFTSPDPDDCQIPSSISFSSLPGPSVATYLWDFGDGGTSTAANPSHTYTSFGSYTVTLTVFSAGGCSFTVTKTNFVNIQPLDVGFEVDQFEGCAPLTVVFNDTTSAPTGITTWLWDFGTGVTSTVSNPTYTFNTPGCYDISLTVGSAAGCSATLDIPSGICVGTDATAFFNVPDTSCPAVTVDVLTAGLDEVDVLIDGAFLSTITSPGATMLIPSVPVGFHDLTLVSYNYGCPDTFQTSIYILEPVDSVITILRDCADPYQVTFIISPIIADSSCGWEWDLGDGTIIANVDTLVYTYASPGFYPLGIEVFCYDLGTCGSLAAGGLTITDPVADFISALDFSCTFPVAINFDDESTDGFNDVLTYAWVFGDGGTAFVSGPTRNYTSAGEFIVQLTVTDVNGCTDTHLDTVNISNLVADFSWLPLCSALDIEITDATVAIGGDITNWLLTFGDGSFTNVVPPATLGSVVHGYPSEGNFDVTLQVTNEFGCVDDITLEVNNIFLDADFEVDDPLPCAGQPVNFENLSVGTGLTYFWDFGVPGILSDTSNLFSPSYTYSATGIYSPTLIITDISGCSDTLTLLDYIVTDTMVVEPFTWVALIENCSFALVEFSPSILDTAEACSYFWNFGDGGVSTEIQPIYPYVLAGEYNVSLTITNCNGCSDILTVNKAITVIGPFGNFAISDDSICIGETVTFNANVVKADSVFLFAGNGDVFGTEILFSDTITSITLTYTYDLPGIYTPQIVIKDSTGCFTVLNGDSLFVGTPPGAAFVLPIDEGCLGITFPLVDSSTSIDPLVSVNWVFSDTTLAGLIGDTIFFTPSVSGNLSFTLYTETAYGCVDSASGSINVLPLPLITLSPDTSICPGISTQLIATGGINYAWTPPTGLDNAGIANPLASPDVTTTYTVIVDDGNCIDSAQVTVTTIMDLDINFGTDATICLGQSAPLFLVLPDSLPGDVLWMWQPSTGLDDPNSLSPIATPSSTTVYQVDVSCGDLVSSGSVTITVSPPLDASIAQGDTTIFPGESVLLPALPLGGGGVFTYSWTPPIDLNCTDCQDVISTPTGDIEYFLTIVDQFGCTDSTSVRINLREECGEGIFEIPNIITPNGDGANDEFTFRYEGVSDIEYVRIFDRWGDLIFESQDVESRWNGSCGGSMCTPGVYVYAIEVVCENQVRTVFAGNITLIR